MTTHSPILERFIQIIQEHGMLTAATYDGLQIDKPSRRVLGKKYGPWRTLLGLAHNDLIERGIKLQSCETPEPPPSTSDEEVIKLQQQVHELTRLIQSPKLCIEGTRHKFGLLADNHMGSLYADEALLDYAYDVFEAEGIKNVFNAGDLSDGQKMHKGHEYELKIIGSDGQVNYIIDKYPHRKGIRTLFISGNHDWSFWKDGGNDIGLKIADKRPDMTYLGHQEADVIIGEKDKKATVRLFHPSDGTAYAISYQTQRYVTELPSGTKPDILLCGHYHKAMYLPWRGVHCFLAGTTQNQTTWMRGRKLAAIMGFWIIDVVVGEERVLRVGQTWFPVRT